MTDYPGTTDLTILQGATLSTVLIANGSDGSPIDWTGYKARMQARATVDASAVLFALTTESTSVTVGGVPTDQGAPGIIITGTQVKLSMSAAATALLAFDKAAYDIELYFTPLGSGPDYVYRPFQGTVALSLNVTR